MSAGAVARNLRAALDAKGYSIAALAEAGGWHRRTVERWLDPGHPSEPTPSKQRVLELLLDLEAGALRREEAA